MTNIEKYEIDVTFEKGQKMKFELKVSVNMKLKLEETVNLAEVLYVPQAVKNILSIFRLVSKGATMGDTQDKMTTKKNGVNIILNAVKGKMRACRYT